MTTVPPVHATDCSTHKAPGHTIILQERLTSLWPSPPSGLVPYLTGRWASLQWCQPENQPRNVGTEARLCNRGENDLPDNQRRRWILLRLIINNIDAWLCSVDRSAALSHYSAHFAETERTTIGKVTNVMTQRSANVTGDVAEPRVGSGMAAMNVDKDTKLKKNIKSLPQPWKKKGTAHAFCMHGPWGLTLAMCCTARAKCWYQPSSMLTALMLKLPVSYWYCLPPLAR